MATPSPKNLLLGAGQVLFNRFDASGNKTGLRHLGNIPKFNLKTEVEKITKKSSMNASRSTYDEAVKETKISADLDLEEFDPANVALALFGEEGIISQKAAEVAGEVHRAFLGRYIQLDAINPTGIKLTAIDPDVTVYEAGVDYQLDPVLLRGGLILIPESSRIPDDTDITVDYQTTAGTFPKVAGGVVSSIEGELMFIGDPAKGPCYNGQFWRVSITPGGELGLISEEYATFPITVTILDDRSHHPDEPFHRLVKVN
ncbi:hypothetical protein [Acetonema longum]|uniref:Uncharacterized protein n=1 Tax=Acetonema longum DSM 6540 TaxID=1009370 RepID=F7NEA0_9FIRM|nr:hypothetical protein [Acetonema longum]EGO65612.1 hypothetical protein ALO_01814 [Acetonema longum DSM 6540]